MPALVPFVQDTHRRVVLGCDGVRVQTVEHLLSACFGLGVTDLLVEVDGEELPIGDGSALLWTEAFTEAGICSLSEAAPVLDLDIPISIEQGQARIEVIPWDRFVAHFVLVSDHPLVGVQEANFDQAEDDFLSAIAPARTFGFWEEVRSLWEQGLAKGGSLENAVVIFPNQYSVPLRFPNELARHKLLDLMGDLFLLGRGLKAKVFAVGSGHTLHWRLCQSIWQRMTQEEETA